MTQFPETFSVLLSIRAFLSDMIPDIPLYLNSILLPEEKTHMLSLSHYLRLDISQGEVRWNQPFDTTFRLYATQTFDPTTLWLQKRPWEIIKTVLNTKTNPALNMIALYDYDSLIGYSGLASFYESATLPDNLLTLAKKRFPDVPYLVKDGIQLGLKALPTSRAPYYEWNAEPMLTSWTMTFRYFESQHLKGSWS